MEDMKILLETGVQMLDEYCKDSFMLKAIIFVTTTITLLCSLYQTSLRERLVEQYALMEQLTCSFLYLRR
jgi:hypothetical protein